MVTRRAGQVIRQKSLENHLDELSLRMQIQPLVRMQKLQ